MKFYFTSSVIRVLRRGVPESTIQRQQAQRLLGLCLRLIGDGTVKRCDLEAAAFGDGRIGQFAHGGEPFHVRQFPPQQGQPVL
jgi:hypothetical protein